MQSTFRLAQPHRRLVKEGPLVDRASRTPDKCHFYLLNDLLMYCDKQKDGVKFKCTFPLGTLCAF